MEHEVTERWVEAKTAAAHLSISRWAIYRMVRKKAVPFGRMGRRLWFRLGDLDEMLQRGTRARRNRRA